MSWKRLCEKLPKSTYNQLRSTEWVLTGDWGEGRCRCSLSKKRKTRRRKKRKKLLLPPQCAAERPHSFVHRWWKSHRGTRVLLRREEMCRSPHISTVTARYMSPPRPEKIAWLHDGCRSQRNRPEMPSAGLHWTHCGTYGSAISSLVLDFHLII